ncbi:MAG TPA: hypothetical protein VF765_37695 [Polyangiaceae bacterium]
MNRGQRTLFVVAMLASLVGATGCGHGGGAASSPTDASTGATGDSASREMDAPCAVYDASGLDPNAVQAGAALVVALKCRHCHNDDLSGNPAGVQTEAGLGYPPNITPDPTTGIGCWTDEQIARAFLDRVDDQGRTLCPQMPRFAEAGVDATGAAEIVDYLRSVPVRVGTVPDTTCALDGGLD